MEKRTAKPQCIALVGLPASGKSTIGSALARKLGLPFVDLDEQIVAGEGRTITQIFKVDGEGAFRELESAFLEKATRGVGGKLVLATGGGCVLSPGNRSLLRERCTVVWLDLSPELAAARAVAGNRKSDAGKTGSNFAGRQAAGRVAPEPAARPLLADGDVLERMRTLDAFRRPLYRESADLVIQVEGKTPAAVVEELYAAMD